MLRICRLLSRGSGTEAEQVQGIADRLVEYSRKCMFNKSRVSPFESECHRHFPYSTNNQTAFQISTPFAHVIWTSGAFANMFVFDESSETLYLLLNVHLIVAKTHSNCADLRRPSSTPGHVFPGRGEWFFLLLTPYPPYHSFYPPSYRNRTSTLWTFYLPFAVLNSSCSVTVIVALVRETT
jgi:hypothetical protein